MDNNHKPLVAVNGITGQLGWEILNIHHLYKEHYEFVFLNRELMDLSKPDTIPNFFVSHKPSYFINCAAYTQVDKAETEREIANNINAISVGVLAKECSLINCVLITISTDYVFNGNGTSPYKTDEDTDPINFYGKTKHDGEKLALSNNPRTIIIRTSWVYSSHGNNFVKTMLRLMKDRPSLNVVEDQLGSPTYAFDLAIAIFKIVSVLETDKPHYGIYHYSNFGCISWFDFASAIAEFAQLPCKVNPIPTTAYPTPAKRPKYSVLDLDNTEKDFGIETIGWESSLKKCLDIILNP